MSKYDEILNELVYRIDDIVYDFYSQSNEIISRKKATERLLEYRDQSLNTVNEMNVRSLEIISDIKKKDLVEDRAEALIQKNEDLVQSILNVLEAAPNKSDVLEDLGEFANKALDSAKDVIKNVESSEAFDKLKTASKSSIDFAKEKYDDITHDERFIKGKEVIIDKTKEAVDVSAAALKEGSQKLSDWIAEKKKESDHHDQDDVESSEGE